MVAPLDGWVNVSTVNTSPGSLTVSAGTDRILLYKTHNRRGTGVELTAVSYGGQAMTEIASDLTNLTGADQDHAVWYLDDAGIEAATDANFAITFASDASGSQYRAQAASYEDVNQTTPLVDSQLDQGGEDTAPTPTAVDTGQNGYVISSWADSEGTNSSPISDVTWSNLTEQIEVTASNTYNSIAHATTDGTSFTPSATFSNPDNNSLITFTLRDTVTNVAAGLVSETDAAQSIAAQRIVPVGLASEADTALVLEQTGTVLVGLASEIDTAQTVSPPFRIQIGLAEEQDAALLVLDGSAALVELVDIWSLISVSAANAGSGETFSISAGSNRMLVVAIGEDSSTGKPTGVQYGGQQMSAGPRAVDTGGFPVTCQFFVLNEAGIAAAVDSNVVVQGVATHNGQFRMFAASYVNVGQGGIVDSDTAENSGSIAGPLTIATTDRGAALGMASNGVGGVDITWLAASEQIEEDGGGTYHTIAEQQTDGSDITFTPQSALINLNVLSVISLAGLARNQAIGQPAETNTAQAIPPARISSVGQSAETDSAQTVTPETGQVVAVGLASETDTAQDTTVFQPGRVQVGLASESSTAQSIDPARSAEIGLSSETDTAQPVTFRREVIVEIAVEVDSARSIVIPGQEFAAALARQRDAGSAGDFASEADMEAKRRGALRRQIEREDDEILTLLPAIAKSLLNLEG